MYVLTTRERAREGRDTVALAVQEGCDIASGEGTTRVYSHARGKIPTRNRRAGRLRSAAVARNLLQAEGWQGCPSWRPIADGARPLVATDGGLGDWPHSWPQCVANSQLTLP